MNQTTAQAPHPLICAALNAAIAKNNTGLIERLSQPNAVLPPLEVLQAELGTRSDANSVSPQRRKKLSPAQQDELRRLSTHLCISQQEGYRLLREGVISLSGQ